jgi:DNA-binding beta-propeller fold protein YncE
MDEQRFDAALRALGCGSTRRQAIAGALGALFGGGVLDAAARKNDKNKGKGRNPSAPGAEGPCGNGSRKDNICTKDTQCCTGICNTKAGKKNKDGQGRCRCVKRGKPCTADRNCCGGRACTGGVCGPGCASNADCPASTPVCTAGTCTGCATDGDCRGELPLCCGGLCTAGTWAPSTTFGSYGSGEDELDEPRGVAISADQLTAWVADFGNSRVSIWNRPDRSSASWSWVTSFGDSQVIDNPMGIAVSSGETMFWVSDVTADVVQIWTRPDAASTSYTYQTQFGSAGSGVGEFDDPRMIAVSPDNLTLWLADYGNSRVVVWTRPDTASTTWTNVTSFGSAGTGPGQFEGPRGISVSQDTLTVWVADDTSNRVSVFTRPNATSTTYTFQTAFGSPGSALNQFQAPHAIYVSRDGLSASIADTENCRIVTWIRTSATSTDWTPQAAFGTGCGPNADEFDEPKGVIVNGNNTTAWVSDQSNNRISVWTRACSFN